MRGIVCYHHHQNNAPQYCLFVWQVILCFFVCLFVCFISKTFLFLCQIKSFSLFRICYRGWFFGNLQSWAELSRQVCPLFNWTKSDNIFLPPSRLGTDFCPKSQKIIFRLLDSILPWQISANFRFPLFSHLHIVFTVG